VGAMDVAGRDDRHSQLATAARGQVGTESETAKS
jgi:hypothetical protein